MSNNDATSIINALIKYFRENNMLISNELANDTNIYIGSLKSVDGKQRATLVFIGEQVVLVLTDIGPDFPPVGNVYVSSKPIVHNVENYQRIAFKKSKTTHTLDFPVDVETCGQRVFESVAKYPEYEYIVTLQFLLNYCMENIHCQKSIQNLIRVGFLSPERVLKVIDGHLRQALKMLPYKDFVYVATHDLTNVAISRQKNMAKDMSQAKMIAFQAGAK